MSEEPTHPPNSYLPLLKFVFQSHVSLDPYRRAKSTYESVDPLIYLLSGYQRSPSSSEDIKPNKGLFLTWWLFTELFDKTLTLLPLGGR